MAFGGRAISLGQLSQDGRVYDFKQGDQVLVLDGPFEGKVGTVTRVGPAFDVTVTLEVFGRSTTIQAAPDQLSPPDGGERGNRFPPDFDPPQGPNAGDRELRTPGPGFGQDGAEVNGVELGETL